MRFILIILLLLMAPQSLKAQNYLSEYSKMSYKAMSDLMWRYKAHSVESQNALNAYFQTHYCDVYEKYFGDDFKWRTLVSGFKREVKDYSKDFPSKFYLVTAIPIDRYDFSKSVFVIDSKSAMNNAGSIEMPFDKRTSICNKKVVDALLFPKNMRFLADREFPLKEIPVNPDEANAILSRIKNNKYEDIKSNKVLISRFLISVNNINEYYKTRFASSIVFGGTLDEVTIFEDASLKKPIWQKQFKIFED